MTGAQTLAAFRRALVPAVVAFVGVLALVVLVMLSRPDSFSARLGLVASPTVSDQTVTSDYGAVVSLTMQALPELAVSDGTLTAIRKAVPAAPPLQQLGNDITVELVPGSSVARISVVADDERLATEEMKALVAQIQAADLLEPVAVLKPIGSGAPTVQKVEQDPRLALGLGIVTGLLAALVTVVLVQALRPRLLTVADVEQVVEETFATGGEVPPVVALGDDGQGLNLLAAHLLVQRPLATEITVVPAGQPLREDLAPRLRNALRDLRVARDAGLPMDPVASSVTADADDLLTAATSPERFRATVPAPGGPAEEVSTAGETAQASSGRPGLFAPMSSRSFGSTDDAVRVQPNPLSHLVLSVRIGRTTPTALTTALVAMRTHGTGIAGVAVG
jgi:hypothetical protein